MFAQGGLLSHSRVNKCVLSHLSLGSIWGEFFPPGANMHINPVSKIFIVVAVCAP